MFNALLLSSLLTALPQPATDIVPPKPGGHQTRTAVFAAGCFWCVEGIFEQLEGVTDVVSGYAGGTAETAKYEVVGGGDTDHAESVKVTYDPNRISYGTLLWVLFSTQDPTTLNRQGPDWGRQYRSTIFFANDDEKRVAQAYIAQLNAAKVFKGPVVTTLEPLKAFYPAEAYHQDFVKLHPTQPYVMAESLPRIEKARTLFPQLLKKTTK